MGRNGIQRKCSTKKLWFHNLLFSALWNIMQELKRMNQSQLILKDRYFYQYVLGKQLKMKRGMYKMTPFKNTVNKIADDIKYICF